MWKPKFGFMLDSEFFEIAGYGDTKQDAIKSLNACLIFVYGASLKQKGKTTVYKPKTHIFGKGDQLCVETIGGRDRKVSILKNNGKFKAVLE